LISSANFLLSASVGCAWATTIGEAAELRCSALFSAAVPGLLIAMMQAKPMAKIAIVHFMKASLK